MGWALGPTLPSGLRCADGGCGCALAVFELGRGGLVGYFLAAVFVADIFEAVFAAFDVEEPIASFGVDASSFK